MVVKVDFIDNNTPVPDQVNAAWLNEVGGKANTCYVKPGGGIPSTDMSSAVTTSLGKADTATQPADLANSLANGIATAQLVSINPQTISYTLVIGDANKMIEMNSSSAVNVTVPPNSSVAFPVGTVIEVVQLGTGQVTIVAGSGVTLNTPLSLLSRTRYSTLALRKRATDIWVVSGDMQ